MLLENSISGQDVVPEESLLRLSMNKDEPSDEDPQSTGYRNRAPHPDETSSGPKFANLRTGFLPKNRKYPIKSQ